MKKESIKRCCICGKKYEGYGNNAEPIKKGQCCDECNNEVIKERIKKII
jgi:hypothetical protein